MKISYITVGSTFSKLLRLFASNCFVFHPRYFFRFFLLFQSSVWSSIFKVVEKIKYNKKIHLSPKPVKPVFIIGHWRTGSTFLHQLMSLDDTFVTPNVFQVTVPDCFISIEKYYKPVMRKLMDTIRPMDNVKFGPDAPQEDEFALFRLSLESPLKRIVFPKKSKYFLLDDAKFMNNTTQSKKWENSLSYFYKKLRFKNHKRILIKNPFHSMRIQALSKLYPDAVFVHIYRNPMDVVPSTIRMWDILAQQNCMNTRWSKPHTKEVASLYSKMLQRIEDDSKQFGSQQFVEVQYEVFEKKPLAEMKRIYSQLQLDFSVELEQKVLAFCQEQKDFQKNIHRLTQDDEQIIKTELKEFMQQKAYV